MGKIKPLDFLLFHTPLTKSIQASKVQFIDRVNDKICSLLKYPEFEIIDIESLIISGTHRGENSFSPYGLLGYSAKKDVVNIRMTEVSEKKQGQGIGSKMLAYLIEHERPCFMEGWAKPDSVGFWKRQGFYLLYERKDCFPRIGWATSDIT